MSAAESPPNVVPLRPNVANPLFGISQRQLPANHAAEQALLGALLANNGALERIQFLRDEHFSEPVHGRIFKAIVTKVEAGGFADTLSLRADFENAGVLDEIGGMGYLALLLSSMVSLAAAAEYGAAIYDAWMRRRLIEIGTDLVTAAFGDGQHSGIDVARMVAGAIDPLTVAPGRGKGYSSALEAVDRAIEYADRAARNSGVVGISTGMASVDDAIGGLEPSKLYVIGGHPGSGKSAIAHQWALSVARGGHQVEEFSLEMNLGELGQRTLAIAAQVPLWRLRKGDYAEVADQIVMARKELARLPLHIHDGQRFTVHDIRARCRAAARKRRLGLILVDHVHLVPVDDATARHGPTAALTKIADAMLGICKEFDCPVILLAQLNRGGFGRDDHRPSLADLRQAGALEQNADVVAFAYRPEIYISKSAPSRMEGEGEEQYTKRLGHYHDLVERMNGEAELICEKVRAGAPTSVKLRFDKQTASFHEIARQV